LLPVGRMWPRERRKRNPNGSPGDRIRAKAPLSTARPRATD
jgi:hypothetical protein